MTTMFAPSRPLMKRSSMISTPTRVVLHERQSIQCRPSTAGRVAALTPRKSTSNHTNTAQQRTNSVENSNIRVVVRPRKQQNAIERSIIEVVGSDSIVYKANAQFNGKPSEFRFDSALSETCTQTDVYNSSQCDNMCNDVVNGYNAGIMLYGQTNAGKTYTSGISCRSDTPVDQQGLAPRIIQRLLDCISEKNTTSDSTMKYSLSCQYIEIYNEKVYDLLSKKRAIKLGFEKSGTDMDGQYHTQDANQRTIETVNDGINILIDGARLRTTAKTNKNEQSSRSHALVIFIVTQACESTNEYGDMQTVKRISKFYLADLAGSENSSATDGLESELSKQSNSINLSLLTLRLVLQALTEKQFVPYKRSNLTKLLQPCTGGSAKTVFIGCIHTDTDSETAAQTLSTLQYCSMAKKITNQIKQAKSIVTIEVLQQQIDDLMQLISDTNTTVVDALGLSFQSPLTSTTKSSLSPYNNTECENENVNTNCTGVQQGNIARKILFSPHKRQQTNQLTKNIGKLVKWVRKDTSDTNSPPRNNNQSQLVLQLQQQMQQLQNDNTTLRTVNNDLSNTNHELTARCNNIQSELNQYQHTTVHQLSTYQQSIDQLNAAQHDLINRLNNITVMLRDKEIQQLNLHDTIDNQCTIILHQRDRYADVQTELHDYQQQLHSMQQEINNANKTIHQYKARQLTYDKQIHKLNETIDVLETQHNNYNAYLQGIIQINTLTIVTKDQSFNTTQYAQHCIALAHVTTELQHQYTAVSVIEFHRRPRSTELKSLISTVDTAHKCIMKYTKQYKTLCSAMYLHAIQQLASTFAIIQELIETIISDWYSSTTIYCSTTYYIY